MRNLHTYIRKFRTKALIFTAFTLAEVLITLGIIGVVAAMTIPTLLQNQQEQQTVAALKKAYSTLSQAYTMAVQENGTPDNWSLGGSDDPQGALNMLNAFAPFLSIIKNCGISTTQDCFPNVIYKNLYGSNHISPNTDNTMAKIQLKDGSLILFIIRNADCTLTRGNSLALQNICAIAIVDTNGFNKPNQYGIDTFYFYITKYGIVPYGTKQETSQTFDSTCKDKTKITTAGYGCTAWVLYNENMDYLHCSNLAWDGPTKCQ